MMRKRPYAVRIVSCLLGIGLVFPVGCSPRKAESGTAPVAPVAASVQKPAEKVPVSEMVADFEGESGEQVNRLGGENGTWNLNPADENNSYADMSVISMPGKDGQGNKVLRLTYSVDSDVPAQNGFWTKLKGFDGSRFDHLELDVKGDSQKGFTGRFRIELKKCKDVDCLESVKGSATVPVTAEWQTVSIPLNKMTGLIDFADPESWKNPMVGYNGLSELIIILNDKFVTRKQGRVFIDNVKFVKTGIPGPSAVDFPPRKTRKTDIPHGTVDYAKFLSKRLRGFPEATVVAKQFPLDDRAFLMEIARDTWRFFDETVDAQNHLPLDNIQLGAKEPLGEGAWIGDYTNVTNVGVYFMAIVSAYDLGFIKKEDAVQRIRNTLASVGKLECHESGFPYNYYDTTLMDPTSYFVSFVDSGWLMLGLYVAKSAFPEVAEHVDQLLKRGDFRFFYDPVEKQMFHGYYANLGVYSDYHYGVFYAEPRAAAYMAIARGDLPEELWFDGMVRTFPANYKWQSQPPKERFAKTVLGYKYFGGYYEWKGLKYVPSWGGSAFEALMPTVVLKEKELAPDGLGKNNAAHALGQARYALEELAQPVWGMSPCSVPEGGYSEYGANPFGIKGYKSGVVTPHATFLTLEYIPKDAIANLRKMLELYGIYGEYGFYDAVSTGTGKVAYKYLALDQAMVLLSLNNYLNHGALRARFHADPEMKKMEKLLSSEKFFEEQPAVETADVLNS